MLLDVRFSTSNYGVDDERPRWMPSIHHTTGLASVLASCSYCQTVTVTGPRERARARERERELY
jgi:hypothetical protein